MESHDALGGLRSRLRQKGASIAPPLRRASLDCDWHYALGPNVAGKRARIGEPYFKNWQSPLPDIKKLPNEAEMSMIVNDFYFWKLECL